MTFPTFIRCCIHCEISHDLSSNQAQCLRSMLNSTHAKSSNEELLKGNIETISCSRSSRLRNWKLQLSLPSGWIYVSILFHCFKEWFEPRAFWKVDEKKKHEVPPKASAALATTAHHSKSRQLERLGPNENLFFQMKEFMFDCRQFYFAVYNSDMIQIWFNLSFTSHEAASNPFLLKRKADVSPHFLRGAKLPDPYRGGRLSNLETLGVTCGRCARLLFLKRKPLLGGNLFWGKMTPDSWRIWSESFQNYVGYAEKKVELVVDACIISLCSKHWLQASITFKKYLEHTPATSLYSTNLKFLNIFHPSWSS